MELHQGDLGAGPYGELCLQGVDTIHTHGPRRHTPSEVEIEASSRAPPSNRRTLLCARSLPPPPLCMCACACVCVSPSLCVSVPLVSFSYPSRLLGKIPPPLSLSLSLSHTHTACYSLSFSLSAMCVCVCVLQAIRTHQTIVCRFYFLDGKAAAVGVEALWTVEDVVAAVSKSISLPDPQGWALYVRW